MAKKSRCSVILRKPAALAYDAASTETRMRGAPNPPSDFGYSGPRRMKRNSIDCLRAEPRAMSSLCMERSVLRGGTSWSRFEMPSWAREYEWHSGTITRHPYDILPYEGTCTPPCTFTPSSTSHVHVGVLVRVRNLANCNTI